MLLVLWGMSSRRFVEVFLNVVGRTGLSIRYLITLNNFIKSSSYKVLFFCVVDTYMYLVETYVYIRYHYLEGSGTYIEQ